MDSIVLIPFISSTVIVMWSGFKIKHNTMGSLCPLKEMVVLRLFNYIGWMSFSTFNQNLNLFISKKVGSDPGDLK